VQLVYTSDQTTGKPRFNESVAWDLHWASLLLWNERRTSKRCCFGFALGLLWICFEVALDLFWASLRLWNERRTSSDEAGTVYSPDIYFTLIVLTSKRCCFGFALGLLMICFEVVLDLLWASLQLWNERRTSKRCCFGFALGLLRYAFDLL
jgi:hypothetical protein